MRIGEIERIGRREYEPIYAPPDPAGVPAEPAPSPADHPAEPVAEPA